jgi:hypothetical protein
MLYTRATTNQASGCKNRRKLRSQNLRAQRRAKHQKKKILYTILDSNKEFKFKFKFAHEISTQRSENWHTSWELEFIGYAYAADLFEGFLLFLPFLPSFFLVFLCFLHAATCGQNAGKMRAKCGQRRAKAGKSS